LIRQYNGKGGWQGTGLTPLKNHEKESFLRQQAHTIEEQMELTRQALRDFQIRRDDLRMVSDAFQAKAQPSVASAESSTIQSAGAHSAN
jgi:hypothetical protein